MTDPCLVAANAIAKPRCGSVLIIVAGLSAILLMLSMAFIARMRSDSEESRQVGRDAQARIMLTGALHLIQEASRLGWSRTPVDASSITDPSWGDECYGWTDVRDGSIGPRGDGPGPDRAETI